MKEVKKVFGKTTLLFFIMMLLCGLLYTLVMTGISQLFFKDKANGSIIEVNGVNTEVNCWDSSLRIPPICGEESCFWMYPPTRMMREIR